VIFLGIVVKLLFFAMSNTQQLTNVVATGLGGSVQDTDSGLVLDLDLTFGNCPSRSQQGSDTIREDPSDEQQMGLLARGSF
jgi:hypothetical protein